MKKYIFILVVALLSLPLMSVGQNLPERGLVRKGNRQFNKGRYDNSSELYQRALLYDSTAFEARYNLGNSLLRRAMADTLAHQNPQSAEAKMVAGYVAQAEGLLQKASADSLRNDADRSDAYYNLGNTQFVQQKLQDALRSYRRALTLNPDDMEAKYNYALTKKLLEQQQQNQQQNNDQNQDNQDQNQDQNQQNQNQNGDGQNDNQNNDQQQEQNQNQNQEQNQGGENEQEQNSGGEDQNDGQNDSQEQEGEAPPRSGMNDKQREQVLNAIQAQEDKTQEKLDEKEKGILIRGRKNW